MANLIGNWTYIVHMLKYSSVWCELTWAYCIHSWGSWVHHQKRWAFCSACSPAPPDPSWFPSSVPVCSSEQLSPVPAVNIQQRWRVKAYKWFCISCCAHVLVQFQDNLQNYRKKTTGLGTLFVMTNHRLTPCRSSKARERVAWHRFSPQLSHIICEKPAK